MGFREYQTKNHKYDLATNTWTRLPDVNELEGIFSFNLLPLFENRFILVISEGRPSHKLFDTLTDEWVDNVL